MEKKSTYIVAEMSANHGGSLQRAIEIIHQAKKIGADAVKLQTYKASTITLNSDSKDFMIPTGPWADKKNLYSLYEEAYTPWEWHKELFQEAKIVGIDIFSSPFDFTAIELLESLDCQMYKIASPEINDIPLLQEVAKLGKPVVLSTGLATQGDIDLAVETLEKNNCKDYTILKCTTAYPTPLDEVNLRTLVDIKQRYKCNVGISDHTNGFLVPVLSVSLGGSFIEKHFTLDKETKTADSFFSMDRDEFKKMIEMVRDAEKCLGRVDYDLTESAKKNIRGRRSLYASKPIKKGEVFSSENVKSVRPSFGLEPKYYYDLIGKKANRNIEFAERLTIEDLS